ncbi:hypothetical protein HK096_011138 [Nowakowskiella sp. JEL0078]|nr:hypothetical protein HK096_011138 [Nowakowskiella sp. JEL0078]
MNEVMRLARKPSTASLASQMSQQLSASHLTIERNQGEIMRIPIASEIVPGLFIGTKIAASDRNFIETHGITHIINMAFELPMLFKDIIEYIHVPLADNTQANLLQRLEELIDVIDNVMAERENINKEFHDSQLTMVKANSEGIPTVKSRLPVVMVHCAQGVSRSAAVVVAWRMRKTHESYSDALYFVRTRRYIVKPNEGFENQLKLFAKWGWSTKGIGYSRWRIMNWVKSGA